MRKIPWFWVAGGLIVLSLVGRGMVGAATGLGHDSPSVAVTSVARTTPPVVPEPSVSVPETLGLPPTVAPTTPVPIDRVVLPRATSTPTVSPSISTPTSTPTSAPVSCSVRSNVAPFWGGAIVTITVQNTSQTKIDDWRLTFRLNDTVQIVNSWGGTFSQHEGSMQVSGTGGNASLASGGSTEVGYQAGAPQGGDGHPEGPRGFELNGVACS